MHCSCTTIYSLDPRSIHLFCLFSFFFLIVHSITYHVHPSLLALVLTESVNCIANSGKFFLSLSVWQEQCNQIRNCKSECGPQIVSIDFNDFLLDLVCNNDRCVSIDPLKSEIECSVPVSKPLTQHHLETYFERLNRQQMGSCWKPICTQFNPFLSLARFCFGLEFHFDKPQYQIFIVFRSDIMIRFQSFAVVSVRLCLIVGVVTTRKG